MLNRAAAMVELASALGLLDWKTRPVLTTASTIAFRGISAKVSKGPICTTIMKGLVRELEGNSWRGVALTCFSTYCTGCNLKRVKVTPTIQPCQMETSVQANEVNSFNTSWMRTMM